MDYILNKLKKLNISGASKITPDGAVTIDDVVVRGHQNDINDKINIEQILPPDRVKSDPANDFAPVMTEQKIANILKETVQVCVVTDNLNGNKSVSLNDILGGPKVAHALVDNECGDSIYKIAEQNNLVSHAVIFDRGDQLQPEMIASPFPVNQAEIAHDQQTAQPAMQLNVARKTPNTDGFLLKEQLKLQVSESELELRTMQDSNLLPEATIKPIGQIGNNASDMTTNIVETILQIDRSELSHSKGTNLQMSSVTPAKIQAGNITPTKEVNKSVENLEKTAALAMSPVVSLPLVEELSQSTNKFSETVEIVNSQLVSIIKEDAGMEIKIPEAEFKRQPTSSSNKPEVLKTNLNNNNAPSTPNVNHIEQNSNRAKLDDLTTVQRKSVDLINASLEDKAEVTKIIKPTENERMGPKDGASSLRISASDALLTGPTKIYPEHGIQQIITDFVNTAPLTLTGNIEIPSLSNFNNGITREVHLQHLPQTKSELPVVCPETNFATTNKIETVKKNLLTMFDTFDSIQPKVIQDKGPIAEIKSDVKKLEVVITTNPLQSISDGIIQTPQTLREFIQNNNQNIISDSLANTTNQAKQSAEPCLDPVIYAIEEINDIAALPLYKEANVTAQNFSMPSLLVSENVQNLNSEIDSNHNKINSTLEAAILNQTLDQQYASDKMPPMLVEQSNNNNSLVKDGHTLENIILNQILMIETQTNLPSPNIEIKGTNYVENQKSTDFQIADIDVHSADNFIEFVDEIIDFALRKVDFLKISETETVQPLTPVPEEAEEASEGVKLNDYYDYCLFTPSVEQQNINFPTLESFEIEELQAKVMEQVDALYLNETPIDQNLHQFLHVPESPKINELQAKALKQAHELNLQGTAAEFVYLHSADNKLKPPTEPVEMNMNMETQHKLPSPIAIAAVQPTQSFFTNSPPSNFSDRSQNESFFLSEPPTMYRSQSNRPQCPMDTSQTKLSQSMNEVYFDKRLDITGKRSFRRERDQKIMLKSKKDHFNENLNREKSQEPQKMLNKDTPRDSLEDLNEIKTDSAATGDNKLIQSMLLDQHIEKQENEEKIDGNNKENKMNQKESLKDSLENLVETVEQEEVGDSIKQRRDTGMEESIRDSLENLVEAEEAAGENVKKYKAVNQKENHNTSNPIEEYSYKQCNYSGKKTGDITAFDEKQQKGVQSDVKPPAEENVIHNTTTIPNSVVQSVESESSVFLSKDLKNAKEQHKDVTMSLDIMNGGDKLVSNKYYESVSDEPKIKTDCIMAEYRKPVGNSNGDLEKIINEYESKEESLIRRLTDKEKIITKMTGVMEAYEKTIAEMIAEKEQLVQEYEKKCVNLKSDADLNAQHLLSLEDTFADLHAKYERSKQITLGLKTNEEELRDGNLKNLELLNAQEIRYEKMKSHAIGQLQIANEKLEHLQRAHAQETTKLKALLKREELARSSLTEQLQQKIRENEELVKICEELIGKE